MNISDNVSQLGVRCDIKGCTKEPYNRRFQGSRYTPVEILYKNKATVKIV